MIKYSGSHSPISYHFVAHAVVKHQKVEPPYCVDERPNPKETEQLAGPHLPDGVHDLKIPHLGFFELYYLHTSFGAFFVLLNDIALSKLSFSDALVHRILKLTWYELYYYVHPELGDEELVFNLLGCRVNLRGKCFSSFITLL